VNYRHAFHAGNFADVHKHVVLLELLEHLHKKSSPFYVLDTHAGRGSYDLRSEAALRSGEWRQGIGRLRAIESLPSNLRAFLALNADAHEYHGSPYLIAAMLRENDRATFVEQHPEEAAALRNTLGKRRHVSVLAEDGYAALKAHLPPKENRGLVLIDPPYESATEFADVARALHTAHERWSNGIYCAWYPLKPGGAEERLHRMLVGTGIKKTLLCEFSIRPVDSPLGLNGSGLIIINPPWQLDEQLRTILPQLNSMLAPERNGNVRIEWLTPE